MTLLALEANIFFHGALVRLLELTAKGAVFPGLARSFHHRDRYGGLAIRCLDEVDFALDSFRFLA